MTVEVALLNRYAVAMAADSMLTVQRKSDRKTFRTVKKLFALSVSEPVGVMVYGDDAVMGRPWETLIQVYRRQLGKQTFDTVAQYAKHFVQFVEGSVEFFPVSGQEEYFISWVRRELQGVADNAKSALEEAFSRQKVSKRQAKILVDNVIESRHKQWSEGPTTAAPELREQLEATYADAVRRIRAQTFGELPMSRRVVRQLEEIASFVFTKRPKDEPDSKWPRSGLVFAGFGRQEIFPALHSFSNVGPVLGCRLCLQPERSFAVTAEQPGELFPFAQTDEIEAFLGGIHPDYKKFLAAALQTLLVEQEQAPNSDPSRVKDAAAKAVENFFDGLEQWQGRHAWWAKAGVASLPKDELAAMAESLVSLAALKHRVNFDEKESVGGPIDVAVISKGDGFVWIKVKNYYDAQLNPPLRPL